MTGAPEPVLLVGAGGLAREAVDAVRAGDEFEVIGYLDDAVTSHGEVRNGIRILGGVDQAADREVRLVLCLGSGAVRLRMEARLAALGIASQRYASIRHPAASVSFSSEVGAGSVLLAGAVLTAEVTLGRHVVAMPNAVLTHDDRLADGVTVCSGVTLGGTVQVGRSAYLGAACVVRENLSVGAGAVIGQGAVVLADVPAGQVWVGNPARFLRQIPEFDRVGAQ